MNRSRLFDAGIEEPELVAADQRARSRRGQARSVAAGKNKNRNVPVARSGRRGAPQQKMGDVIGLASRRGSRPVSGPKIDPRIAARRADVEAHEAAAGSRRRHRLAVATISVVVVTAATALGLLSPLVSVHSIEVRGAQRSGTAAVRAASGLSGGTPLVRIDPGKVAARIAALPWVQRARVERRWPTTVVVSVVERRPAAIAPCHAGRSSSCLVDAEGRVVAAVADAPAMAEALPRLVGVAEADEPGSAVPDTVRGALAVAVALPDALRPLVLGVRAEGSEVALDLQAPGRAASPPVVRLGAPDHIPEKLTAVTTVLARTSVNGVAVLDVRVPASPALTRLRR